MGSKNTIDDLNIYNVSYTRSSGITSHAHSGIYYCYKIVLVIQYLYYNINSSSDTTVITVNENFATRLVQYFSIAKGNAEYGYIASNKINIKFLNYTKDIAFFFSFVYFK